MDNLVNETNSRLQEIIDNLTTIKEEYEKKLNINSTEMEKELESVKQYKEEFFTSKEKIDKMNSDIEGFEQDYQNLVDRFKDDELANILIAANKEISLKIEERKRKIMNDKAAMNGLVEKAEKVKKKLVKLTAEKKALEICLDKILDSYNYYTKVLAEIIEYSEAHRGNLTNNTDSVATPDIKLDSEEYNIDSMKEEASKDEYISEEIIVKDDTEELDDEEPEITLEEIEEEPKKEKKKNKKKKEETEEVEESTEEEPTESNSVSEVDEIPASIFSFDNVIGFDDEIEDEN